MPYSKLFPRRAVLGSSLGFALAAASTRVARATESVLPPAAVSRMPVLYVSHGAPLLPIDPVRSGELTAWGQNLPKPRGILVMTPHFGARRLGLGPSAKGFGMYDMPGWVKRQLPQNLDYATPPSEALARRVEELLAEEAPLDRPLRRGFDHTTWMPLYYLFPAADVPVLELSFPYRPDADIFALGQKLSMLRNEGIVFCASGQWTHNLAALTLDGPAPAWSKEFDAWGAETLTAANIDALLDWRRKAPAAEIAHPDDGGHFRVLLFVLGALLGGGGRLKEVRFPVLGFEGSLSKRCIELT